MVYKDRSVGVVVPAFNEDLLIEESLRSIPDFVDRIFVVDDCSSDRTSEIVKEFETIDSRIKCIGHQENKGVGAAIATGYKNALEERLDIIAVMAGDNQMDGKNLPLLLDPIVDNKADYTKGNRLFSSEFRAGMSHWRVLGNILLTFLTKMASGYWQLMDPQNGYAAISRNALERIDLDKLYPKYGYCNDLLVKLNVFGFRVMDVIMPAKYGKEKSKIRYANYIPKVSWLLFKDFLWRLKVKYCWLSFHPLILFYIFALILVPLGLLGITYSIYYKFILGHDLFIRAVLSLLIFILGTQFLFFAMFFDMQASDSIRIIEED
ncbi:MAG: glycosyltransferase family 2 protein [Methanotrichaceae archaeon]|nr:glycosyltransferase family 2 protein [Methanotrichaceae archaeon]